MIRIQQLFYPCIMIWLSRALLVLSSFMMIREDYAQEDCIKGTCNIEQTCEKESERETMSASKPSSAVMLYEPLSFLKPFNQEERTFTVAGHLIHIHQMWQELGVAAVVWDAAIVLTEYLELQVSAGRLVMKDKRIIELGAGTGLVSLASAILGGNTTSTDRGDTLRILKKNIEANLEDDLSSFRDLLTVQKLDWGENLEVFQEPFDLILGADIIYIEETFEKLLATIKHLSTKATRLLLSCRIRYDRDLRFLEMLRQFYEVKKVHKDRQRGIDIYRATLL